MKIDTKIRLLVLVYLALAVSGTPSELGKTCSADSDCNPPYDTCDMEEKQCVHKGLFPMEVMEVVGSLILGLVIPFCNAGGIGGGEIIVPIMIVFFQFAPKQATPLSNFNIFLGSVARFIINFKQKHPKKNAKAIDYGIVMVMLPMILLGNLIGVKINKMLPDPILLGILTIIMIIVSIKTLSKAIKLRKAENEEIAKKTKVGEEPSETPAQDKGVKIELDRLESQHDLLSNSNNPSDPTKPTTKNNAGDEDFFASGKEIDGDESPQESLPDLEVAKPGIASKRQESNVVRLDDKDSDSEKNNSAPQPSNADSEFSQDLEECKEHCKS